MKKLLFTAAFLLLSLQLNAQVTTNSGSGLAPTYTSLDNAITALNAATITSPVVITLTGNETAPIGGYSITAQGTAVNTITIQGSGSTITANAGLLVGSITDAIFKLVGADYVTLQNFTMQENALNIVITPGANTMTEWGVAILHSSVTNGSQNNTIQNNTISLNRTYTNSFGVYGNNRHSATDALTTEDITNNTTGPNSGNKIYTNNISNVNFGIALLGSIDPNMDVSNDVGGAGLGTGNSITNWGGAGQGSLYVGNTTISYGMFLNHQFAINCSFNTMVSAAVNYGGTFLGIYVDYSVTGPVGAMTNNVNSNTVTMTNSFASATATQIQGIRHSCAVGTNASATANVNSNNILNVTINGVAPVAITLLGILNTAAFGTVNINSNTVQGTTSTATTGGQLAISNQGNVINTVNMNNNNVGTALTNAITYSATTTGQTNGILNSLGVATTTVNITGNTVQGYSFGVGGGQISAVSNQAPLVTAVNITNNQIGTASRPYTTYGGASSGAVLGVFNSAGAAAGLITITGNDIRGVVHNVTGTAQHLYYLNQTYTGSLNMSSNTITNITANTTGTCTFFSNSVAHAAGSVQNVNLNSVVTAYNRTGASGACNFYNAFGTSPSTVTEINNGNNISNVTFTGTTTSFGWRSADGTTSAPFGSRKTITNNTISNITGGAGNITSLLYVGASDNTFNGSNVSNNTISGVNASANIFGIISDLGNQNFFQNVISSLSSTGAAAQVRGFNFTGGTVQNVYRNRISNLTANGATATVQGIAISAGTTFNINNNFIGPFFAPTTSSTTDAIRGISSTSTTTLSNLNVYFNTIYINTSSSGVDFSTSGIFVTTSTTATTAALDLIDNIIINTSSASGAGTTAAYRRSSTDLTNYTATSNYNDFYAGVPSATNLIFNDGTNSDQTLANYKARVTPSDVNSVSIPVNFVNTGNGDLHLTGASLGNFTLAGLSMGGITYDYDGETRNAITYMGADDNPGFPAPVELSSFSANVNRSKVTLSWSTVSEINNSGFDIERKATASSDWIRVGNVAGNGTTNLVQNYTFSESNLAAGNYSYRLKQVDFNGNFKYYDLSGEVIVGVPTKFNISQNYPNPFNPSTKINFDLPFDSKVQITLFDMTGRQVATILNANQTAGYQTVSFNASNLSSGAYFYQINATGGSQSFVKTMKMMLVK